jgi:nitroimidazol reductase NimA-like FMN-containing flavoprotein (pyridoxamine 5'-phosphate oxidase superfamily)
VTAAVSTEARVLEAIEPAECWRLLATRTVGRVAVNRRGAGPLVVPVVYAVDDEQAVVFRTAVGTKLARVARGALSFQVDDVDEERHTGWSVLLVGLAHEIDLQSAAVVGLRPWFDGRLEHAVRVVPSSITGRRVVPCADTGTC